MNRPFRFSTIGWMIALAACTPPVVKDPNAVGPNADRWESTVQVAPARVYSMALAVLNDSSYTIVRSDAASGIIETRPRKESEVQRGTQQLRTLTLGSDYPITLRVLVLPVGTDSARLSINGDYTLENIGASQRIDARTGEWRFVQGIGAAILGRLR